MLSITRKKGQSFKIGDDISVTVTRARSGWARITIDAPTHCKILRSELINKSLEQIPVADVEFILDKSDQ
ncbi:MAG: carbon storage regulator [Zhongshania sp.]|nr:carbon storage regulator [Zhongshania sp.]